MDYKALLKAAILAPYATLQMVVWFYMTLAMAKFMLWSLFSWEQETPEYWVLIMIAYFIWTNNIIKELNS